MACTSIPVSPEQRKPLHTQVVSLREERVSLLEQNRALKEDKDTLTQQLAKASERITDLMTRLGATEAATAQAIEAKERTERELDLKDALATQLRIECPQGTL